MKLCRKQHLAVAERVTFGVEKFFNLRMRKRKEQPQNKKRQTGR